MHQRWSVKENRSVKDVKLFPRKGNPCHPGQWSALWDCKCQIVDDGSIPSKSRREVSANLFWTFHFFAENLESAQNFWIIVKISSHCLWIKTFLLHMSYLYFDNLTLKTLDFHDLRTFVAIFCHFCGLKSSSAIFPLFEGMDGSSSSSVIF